jgi:hypothetical protein
MVQRKRRSRRRWRKLRKERQQQEQHLVDRAEFLLLTEPAVRAFAERLADSAVAIGQAMGNAIREELGKASLARRITPLVSMLDAVKELVEDPIVQAAVLEQQGKA